jgi:hypothetical protein
MVGKQTAQRNLLRRLVLLGRLAQLGFGSVIKLPPVLAFEACGHGPQQVQTNLRSSLLYQPIGNDGPNTLQLGNRADSNFAQPLSALRPQIAKRLNWCLQSAFTSFG